MTTLRTAAQQALEALELAQTDVHWELNSPTRKFLLKAEKSLRAALAEPTLQTCNCRWDGEVQVQQCTLHEAHVDAIHEWAERAKTAETKLAALAEPVQEPVAWSYELATTMLEHGYDGWEHRITRYKPNVPEGSIRNLTPLYAAPPQRKPLTEEEIREMFFAELRALPSYPSAIEELPVRFARAVEQAHGITL